MLYPFHVARGGTSLSYVLCVFPAVKLFNYSGASIT